MKLPIAKLPIAKLPIAVMFALALALGALIGLAIKPQTALAKSPPCSKSEMVIPDDRPGGGKLCLKKSEWAQARKNCAKYAKGRKVDPMDCICQDGSTVGACGN
jgi:hypothetical protein